MRILFRFRDSCSMFVGFKDIRRKEGRNGGCFEEIEKLCERKIEN